VLNTFQDLGRDMFLTGLVGSHTGTMSVRSDGRAIISRRGAMLGRLQEGDLIEFDVDQDCPDDVPDDAIVHQLVYRSTDAQAVIYARPSATMGLALIDDRLSPANGEGEEVLGTAPVLIAQRAIGSSEMANLVSRTLKDNRIVAIRGLGVFARGETLEDAFRVVSLLEEMCKVNHIYRSLAREETQPGVREFHEQRNRVGSFQRKGNNGNIGPSRGGGRSDGNVGPQGDGPRNQSGLGPFRDGRTESSRAPGRRPPRRPQPQEPRHPAGPRRGPAPHR
jgi:L-fuculose-phosphate aldolase